MQENKETADKDFCEIIQMACPYSHDCLRKGNGEVGGSGRG